MTPSWRIRKNIFANSTSFARKAVCRGREEEFFGFGVLLDLLGDSHWDYLPRAQAGTQSSQARRNLQTPKAQLSDLPPRSPLRSKGVFDEGNLCLLIWGPAGDAAADGHGVATGLSPP